MVNSIIKDEWEVVQQSGACASVNTDRRDLSEDDSASKHISKAYTPDAKEQATNEKHKSRSRPHDLDTAEGFVGNRLESPEMAFDTDDGWSSISSECEHALADDTLDMSAFSSSNASEVAACGSQAHADVEPPVVKDDATHAHAPEEALPRDQLEGDLPAELSPTLAAGSLGYPKDRGFFPRLQRHVRACIDMIVKFLSCGANVAKEALARMHTHLKALKASDYQRYALPAAVLGLAVTAVVLVLDNTRLRKELRGSCSDEKINRLIVSGLRMKAALTNHTDFNGSFRSASLFL